MIQRVLVTGASRGIGRAVVERLLRSGRSVIAIARDAERLKSIEAMDPSRVHAMAADLEDPTVVQTLLPRSIERVGSIDGMVCAAGIAEHRDLEAIDTAQIDRHLAIHVRAPLLLSRDFAKLTSGAGSVVLVASTLAQQGAAGTSVYTASKGAVVSMTRALAIELAPRIRVNCIAPGAVDTDMIRSRDEDAQRALRDRHPLGRFGTPEEVAAMIEFVLDAEWMTGSVTTIDGGLTAR